MTRPIKLLMIFFVIISFSLGITTLVAMFQPANSNPQFYFLMSFISFTISHIINEEIITKESEV